MGKKGNSLRRDTSSEKERKCPCLPHLEGEKGGGNFMRGRKRREKTW